MSLPTMTAGRTSERTSSTMTRRAVGRRTRYDTQILTNTEMFCPVPCGAAKRVTETQFLGGYACSTPTVFQVI